MKAPSRSPLGAPAPAPTSTARLGHVAACFAALSAASALVAQDVDLTQYAPIKQSPNATYAYYARGDASGAAITPYTVKFYPGNPHGGNTTTDRDGALADTGSSAAPVPFASGDLTDGSTSTAVSGWIDVEDAHGAGAADPHPGTFDILFDLGAAYAVSSVELVYTDAGGRRWVTGGTYSAQQVSTALSFQGGAPTDADFTPLASQTFASGATSATATFSAGAPRPARYINLRLHATLSPGATGSVGGYLNEVRIFGSPRALHVAYRADDFVESIGVCTHFKSITTNTDWVNHFGTLKQRLAELGLRHIRDDMPINNPSGYARLQQLYNDHGITTTWMPWAWGRPAPSDVEVISRLKAAPYIEAVEGPNEPENAVIAGTSPYAYGGFTDDIDAGAYAATRAWQQMIHEAIKADPDTAHIPVISAAMAWPHNLQRLQPPTALDAAGMHSYPSGAMPSADAHFYFGTTALPTVRALADGKPIVVTETGYHNALGTTRVHPPVSEAAQAKYTPRLYAEYLLHGIGSTFVHQLIDDGSGTPGELADQEKNFGWLRHDLAPKPVFDAMRRLIAHLREASWEPVTKQWIAPAFTPGVLDYTISGGGPNLRRLLLQKADGERILILWNEVHSYSYTRSGNTVTQNDIINTDVPVTLVFNERIASASVYRLGQDTAQLIASNPTTLQIGVPDELLLVKLAPAPLPPPWVEQNVGPAGAAGLSTFIDDDTLVVTGSGIGTVSTGDSDAFHLAARTVVGNTTLVARVSAGAMKAGLTIRETADADARHATIAVHSWNDVQFQSRTVTGSGNIRDTASGVSAPRWLKLSRTGNVFSAWHSSDGASWTKVGGDISIAMPATALAGFVVCSGSPTVPHTATFDQLSITNDAPLVMIDCIDPIASTQPVDSGTFVVTRTGSTATSLVVDYTLGGSASNATHYNAPTSVTIPAGDSSATIAIAPVSNIHAAGRRDIVATLSPSAGYRLGAKISAAASLRIGDGILDDFEAGALSGWGTASPSASTVAKETNSAHIRQGSGALRWTFTPNGSVANNELRLDFATSQDWIAATKIVLWLKEADANPDADFGQKIYYDYRTANQTSVSGNTGVGSIVLTKAPGYRRIELDLGQHNRAAVVRLYFYVNGTALSNLSSAPRTWYIDDITFEDAAGHALPLYASVWRPESLDAYGQWKLAHDLPADIDDRAAPDGDGIPVLMKFATGLVPGESSPTAPADLVHADDRLALRFKRRSPAPVAYRVEASADLAAWSSLASLALGSDQWQGPGRVLESSQDDPRLVIVEDTAAVSDFPRRFLRLVATRTLP